MVVGASMAEGILLAKKKDQFPNWPFFYTELNHLIKKLY